MISRLGLCLVAVAMMIAAASGSPATGAAKLQEMRSRFRSMVQAPPTYEVSASASAGEPKPYAPRFSPSPSRYQPAASPAEYAPATPRSPSFGSRTNSYKSSPRRSPAPVKTPRAYYEEPEEPAYESDVEDYEPAPAFKPKYKPAAYVHPPVPRVAANRDAFRNRARFDVSTSAAAGNGGAAAASSSSSPSGAASAKAKATVSASPLDYDSHEVEREHTSEHYSEPETATEYEATAGTHTNDGKGLVTSSYVRSTDSEENHEDGKEDSDHYYNAGSYGKTYDENKREAYDNDDEDVVYTPEYFSSKRSKTKYQKDASKQRRESGSRVLAKDRHSASYNKDNKKFKENVDQHFHKEGEGVLETGHSSEASDFDEESEEARDSRNLGTFVGVNGVRHAKRPAFNPAAAAAATASNNGVTSNSSAGRR